MLCSHMTTRWVVVPKSILTVKEVADYLQFHRSTIIRLIKRHELPAFQIGERWRIRVEELDQWRLRAESTSHMGESPVENVQHRRQRK